MSLHWGGRGLGHVSRWPKASTGLALALDFTTGALDSRITFTRASTATYVNSSGLIASAAVDAARFDYNPSTLVALGLLIEEQRTNLCLYSDDLTNAAWTATTCTTAMTATGPDGVSNSATTVTATAGNATILQAITSASAARITSCWIKRRTGSGTINMTQDNGATWAAVTVTASWTRVSIASATLANPTVGLQIVTNGDAVDVALFQHEVGAFITSAIPTTSATVTRSADSVSMTGTNFSSWYNQSAGTWVMAIDTYGHTPAYGATFLLADGAAGTFLYNEGSDSIISCYQGVNLQKSNGGSSIAAGAKIGVTYDATGRSLTIDGATVATDANAFGTSFTQLFIGQNHASAAYINGHIKTLTYYRARKANSQLQALTA